nr:L,D-transpeptidase family protein [Alteripontixanthobacter muriae]
MACAVAAFGLRPWSSESGAAKEQEQLTPAPTPDQTRLYLNASQSEQAGLSGVLPRGTRSILNVRGRMRYGDFVWDVGDAAGPLVIRVDLKRQLISVFRGGHEIGTAVVLFGAQGHETPVGRFPIKAKLENYRSRTYDAPMPFTLWLTDDGVAIHGSEVRWGAATHGCIGVPTDFAQSLFHLASVGDVVEIRGAT